MDVEQLKTTILNALEERKGRDIVTIDVRGISGVTDYMVVCSGTSSRHVKSLADNVWVEAKKLGATPIGMEGQRSSDWVLVDFGDVVVHVMLPEAREFYDLERLWQVPASNDDQNED
ncbi:ribosome silencing factor RsfS/YbeB/iojap [Spongiibacter sp. IMCC21906]|jgi:ribosome-associated protein|uniref:ribosome silencing factor n=1 Tax=Spongiibacter sp. IMCC21906 TaxID=1620392 RepID=UPI00062DF921|nr:ribosome silencing factor [Spongiibacter sp. IMCC21906]AKH70846.1 ribosome silencing factor RsfS/YbeB/iojap [Spongiibacter sp. IMCC21906]